MADTRRRWNCSFEMDGGTTKVHSSLSSARRNHHRRNTRPVREMGDEIEIPAKTREMTDRIGGQIVERMSVGQELSNEL